MAYNCFGFFCWLPPPAWYGSAGCAPTPLREVSAMDWILKYTRIWKRLAIMGFKIQTGHPLSSSGYLLGKVVRIVFFIVFLVAIFQHTQALAGYTLAEVAL